MLVSDAFPSKYLKKEDFKTPRQLIIDAVTMENIAQEGHPADMKLVIYFNGAPKPMIANKTVALVVGAMFGNETDAWCGKTVEVFNDVTVVYNGAVGGIRIRPATGRVVAQPMSQAGALTDPPADFDDDVPNW